MSHTSVNRGIFQVNTSKAKETLDFYDASADDLCEVWAVAKLKEGQAALTVDIPEALLTQIRAIADYDGRKLNWLVKELLLLGLVQYRQHHPRPDANLIDDPASTSMRPLFPELAPARDHLPRSIDS